MKHKPGEPYDRRQLKDAVKAVEDPGEGPGGACRASHPLFLDETEAQRAEKNFFGDRPTLGSLSNYDDFKTTTGSARASRFLVNFFDVDCTTTT